MDRPGEVSLETQVRKLRSYLEYKDSGFEWLGSIPKHWKAQRLKYLCLRSALYGANEPATAYTDEGVRFLRTTDIADSGELLEQGAVFVEKESVDGYMLNDGDLLLSRSGTLGRAFHYISAKHGSCAYAGYLVRFVPGPELRSAFAYYFTKSDPFQKWISASSIQSTIGNVSGQKYANLGLPVPPLSEQRALVRFLDRETGKLDALVTDKRRLIELLREKRAALITQAVTKGLNPNAHMRDSGAEWLGEIPAHWTLPDLRRIARPGTSITYGIVQAGPDIPGGIPYIRTSDMSGDVLPRAGYQCTSPEIDASYRRSKVSAGDLVVAIRATVGKTLLVPDYLEGANLTQGTAKISPRESVLSAFLLLALQSARSQARFAALSKGATFREITLDMLRRFIVPLPPFGEQQEIAEYCHREIDLLDQSISKVCEAIERLQEFRVALISSAVTGRIDVREEIAG